MKSNTSVIQIRPIKKSDNVKPFLDFICELIDEDTYILMDTKPTLKEETIWFKDHLNAELKKQGISLTAWNQNKLIGICTVRKGKWKDCSNVVIGIAILKKYRGQGLGERLLVSIIKLAKQKLKPKNIYLDVAEPNLPARSLYKKAGFKPIARLPDWILHKGKYCDKIIMLLKESK